VPRSGWRFDLVLVACFANDYGRPKH
jgi:hypothetical protein